MGQHTPGPWAWFSQYKAGIYLATPHLGHLIVMDFVRLGMQYGQPRFATWKGEERGRMGGIMVPSEKLDVAKHPDALLIAAAPDLLAACELWDKGFVDGEEFEPAEFLSWVNHNRRAARAAIAKAKGQTP